MYGDFAELKVIVESDDSLPRELWQISGDQGTSWHFKSILMPNCLTQFQVRNY